MRMELLVNKWFVVGSHPSLCIRKLQGMTKVGTYIHFFISFARFQEINHHNPARFFNVDQSGIQTVQSKNLRVGTLKEVT